MFLFSSIQRSILGSMTKNRPPSTASGGAGAGRGPIARAVTRASCARTSTTAGRAWATSAPSRPRWRGRWRKASSPPTTAPTSASTSPSTPTAAASTAASTATRAPPTPTSASRRGSTSRPVSPPRSTRRRLLERELASPRYVPKVIALGAIHRPLPADRARAPHHPLGPGGAGCREPPGGHRHQVGAGGARSRHPGAHGQPAASSRSPSP